MIITGSELDEQGRRRITGVEGDVNVPSVQRYANISSSIRRGLSQVRQHGLNTQPLCLVGSGPSLDSTLEDLRDCKARGYPIVAMNGSYEWLLAQDIQPTSMVMVDARPFNARFITRRVQPCSYFLASQCSSELFDKVTGWPHVFIWHCLTGDDPDEKTLLDDYYLHRWQPVSGGCTVGLRALTLFRLLGFQFFEIFGMDSCYLDSRGHCIDQPENDSDACQAVYLEDRRFLCSAWHIAQVQGFVEFVQANGEYFSMNFHGNGLLAAIVRGGHQASDAIINQLNAR